MRGAGNGIAERTHKFLGAALGRNAAEHGNIEVVIAHTHGPVMLAKGSSQLMSTHNFVAIGWHREGKRAAVVPIHCQTHPSAHVGALGNRAKRSSWHGLRIVHA
jgi:hypothetical protein